MTAPALTVYAQGQGEIDADGANTFEQTCDTFAQLRAFVGTPGLQVSCRGGATVGDALGGEFYWNPSATAPDDGSGVIAPAGAAQGRWLRLGYFLQSQQSADILNPIQDFGGISSPTIDNTAAFVAARASGDPIFIPYGMYKTQLTPTQLPNRMWGDGNVFDVSGNQRGRFFTQINTPPTSFGDWDSIETAFDGDLTRVPFPIEHRVTGALTNPANALTNIYSQPPELSAMPISFYNTAGGDLTQSGGGRTGISFMHLDVGQYGGGDAGGITAVGFVTGTNASAVNFLQNPAVFLLNGQTIAGQDFTYLNPLEIHNSDDGFDVASIGFVMNSIRTKNGGGGSAQKYVFWAGLTSQSQGSVAIDTHFRATGSAHWGLDLSFCTFDANKAAIALKADDRILFNVTASDPSGLGRFPSGPGNCWMNFDSGGFLSFVVNGGSVLQIYAAQMISLLPFRVTASAPDSGSASSNTLTGVSDVTANSTGVGTILFKGATSRNSVGFVKMYIGTTAVYVPAFSAITG